MWLLKDRDGKPVYLKCNEAFIVGRKKGSLVLSDDSVSRNHAELTIISKKNSQMKNETESSSACIIKDIGSKYGTYIIRGDDPELQVSKQGNQLRHMDRVRFGAQQSIFTVMYVPLITATSGLDANEKNELQSVVDATDGKISAKWESECTHMTISKSNISEKLTCALASGAHIVPVEYWKFVRKAFEANEELPDPMEFERLIKDKLKLLYNISFAPNPQRQTIFKDLTFVHYDSGQYNLHKRMIELAGGKSMLHRHQKENTIDVCDDNVIVIQLVESNTTQATGTGDGSYLTACEKLGKCRRRAVPSGEIALAIFHCSIEKFCNPKHDHAGIFKRKNVNTSKSAILAADTLDVDYPPISNLQGESSRKALVQETAESSNVDSQSFDVSAKSGNNLTVSTANTSCLSQMTNPSTSKRSRVFDSQSDKANAKNRTQNSQSHVNYESHVVLEMNESLMKRGRDDDDDDDDVVEVTRKKVRNEFSQHNLREQEEPEKTKIIHVDSMSDEDDDESSFQKRSSGANEKCSVSKSFSSAAQNEMSEEPSLKNDYEVFHDPPTDGEIIPETIPTGPSTSSCVRGESHVDDVETFRKPKSVDDSSSWMSLKNPLKRRQTSNSSPKKKLKIPDLPEAGQRTLTKFLSPKKNTSGLNSTDTSIPFIDSKKGKTKLGFDASCDVKPEDISFQRLLRVESFDDVANSSEPRFRKNFRKAYRVKPRRVEMDDMIDMRLWSEKQSKPNEKSAKTRKVSPSSKVKNTFRV